MDPEAPYPGPAHGQTGGKELAGHRHYNRRKPEPEIAKALQYNGRDGHFFALKQEWATYLHLQGRITQIDRQIQKHLVDVIDGDADKKQHIASEKPYKRKNKNTVRGLDTSQVSYRYFEGVDPMAIEGINDATVMAIIGEIGLEGIQKVPQRQTVHALARAGPQQQNIGREGTANGIPLPGPKEKVEARKQDNSF